MRCGAGSGIFAVTLRQREKETHYEREAIGVASALRAGGGAGGRAGARGRLRHAGGQKHRDPPIEVFETLADDAATGDSADPGGPPEQSPSPSPLDNPAASGSGDATPEDAAPDGAPDPVAQSVAAALPLVAVTSDTDTAPSASAAPASAAPLADTEPDVSPLSETPPAPTATGLVALNVPNASTATHAPDADGWVTCGTLRVRGDTYGTDFIYYPDMFQYPKEDGTVVSYGFVGYGGYAKADCILVLTSTPLTFKNAAAPTPTPLDTPTPPRRAFTSPPATMGKSLLTE